MKPLFNRLRWSAALVLIGFAFLGFGPIPITSSLGLFIVVFRPKWFKTFVDALYVGKNDKL